MKYYYRVMLGKGSVYAQECIAGNFVGTDFGINQDLANKLPDEWRAFNREFAPIFLKLHPDKTKVAAGLACGALWTVSKGIKKGDIVLCPDGEGHYHVGEVSGDYFYQSGGVLPHRRPVHWFSQTIGRTEMSEPLKMSTGSIGTVCNITGHNVEIESFISGVSVPKIISTDETVEDPSAFAMEKHLEDFLVKNWFQTNFAREYDIYQEEGESVGQQYPTDTGPIDILAISKDKKTLLVLELKRGRASDIVVGQTLRYMGYVQDELAEESQSVKGVIIALEDDQRIRRALAVSPNITFYRYQITFKLVKA
ncbi:MAG: endonuclease NucS domain-containing protein [Chloroflexota bacterium]